MTNIEFQRGAIDASGCVSNAWEMVKQNYGMYLGISLIAMILAGCIPCVSLFLVGPVLGGVYFVYLRQMRGEPVEFGMMFKGFEKFLPLMVIGIIASIPEIIGQILRFTVDLGRLGLMGDGRNKDFQFFQQGSNPEFAIATGLLIIIAIVAFVVIIFAVVWRVLLVFAIPLAMEYDLGVIDAIKLSARAATSNIGGLIVLFIFEFLIALLGVLALCIGIFFVIPIIYAANAFAYRQVFPLIEQRFNMSPPPPTAYGNFGSGM